MPYRNITGRVARIYIERTADGFVLGSTTHADEVNAEGYPLDVKEAPKLLIRAAADVGANVARLLGETHTFEQYYREPEPEETEATEA